MDIKITKSNGQVFKLADLNGGAVSVDVSSLSFLSEDSIVEGRHGYLMGERTYDSRVITVPFYFFHNGYNYQKKRDLLFNMFSDAQSVKIEILDGERGYKFADLKGVTDVSVGYDMNYIGKRYDAYLVGPIDLERSHNIAEGVLTFQTAEKPFAESVNVIKRKYTTNEFNFNNQGLKIDMRQQSETVITFKGASNGLTIKNLTTGSEWKYNGSTTADDEIKLIGVRSLKNGQSIFGNTNHKMIDFAPGNNKFEISGTSGAFELNIATRFYFL